MTDHNCNRALGRRLLSLPAGVLAPIDMDSIRSKAQAARDRQLREYVTSALGPDLARQYMTLRKRPPAPRCGAHARTTGAPCQAASLANGRCAIHGGLSSGPRTPEGRERIRESNRRRANDGTTE